MDAWVIWVLAAVVLAVAEILTTTLFVGPFAVGALLAAAVDAAGGGPAPPGGAFLVSPVLLLGVARPIARRHMTMPPALRTGTAALVGETAIVTQRIVNDEGQGCVKLGGEVWTARAYDDDDGVIEAGQRVYVIEIK